MSLKNTILDYLQSKYPNEVHKGELGRKAVLEWGFENENMGRRCRELVNEGLIQPIYRKNPKNGVTEAWYKFKPTDKTWYLKPEYSRQVPAPKINQQMLI